MSLSTSDPSPSAGHPGVPLVQLSYYCILRERPREAVSPLYEVACSLTYPTTSAHLSVRVTGPNTYRNAPAREILYTPHETGATTSVELLEAEQLEVRIVEEGGLYAKAVYYAHGQALIEQHARRIVSTIQRLASPSDRIQG